MKNILSIFVLSVLGWLISTGSSLAQADEKLLFAGLDVLKGVGKYNGITYGVGGSIRYHHPIRQHVALTARVGLEYYKIRYYSYVPSTYLGYGYNAITGFGFNTIYYGAGNLYEYETHGVNLPITVAPRLYLPNVLPGLHADLNLGADMALSKSLITSLHVAPGAGYALPLKTGQYLDITTNFVTSFSRGSGLFTIGAAYGLPVKR